MCVLLNRPNFIDHYTLAKQTAILTIQNSAEQQSVILNVYGRLLGHCVESINSTNMNNHGLNVGLV